MTVKIQAPAKINLTLDITGKRADGYHTLSTIMQSISLSDIVTISGTDTGMITINSSNPLLPTDERNIAYKAAEKFLKKTNIQHNGLHIHIQKNIPSEAGLGGGSADAAAVLTGLNYMFRTKLSVNQLCEISATIGADVPFCIIGGTKFCTGIGEIMTEAKPLEQCYIVIAKGSSGISTKSAFEKIDAMEFNTEFDCSIYDGSICSVKKIGYNIFEMVADNYDVDFIKNKMLKFNSNYSAMSGSGSAVFGLFSNLKHAEKCNKYFLDNNFFSYLCMPLSNGSLVIA